MNRIDYNDMVELGGCVGSMGLLDGVDGGDELVIDDVVERGGKDGLECRVMGVWR